MKILIIEDDEMQATYLKLRLQNRYEVFIAENLKSGIEQCNTIKPDVVMLDIGLPDAENYKNVLERIEKVRGEAAVIIITGWDIPHTFVIECIKRKTDGFIVKGKGDRTNDLLDDEIKRAIKHRAKKS